MKKSQFAKLALGGLFGMLLAASAPAAGTDSTAQQLSTGNDSTALFTLLPFDDEHKNYHGRKHGDKHHGHDDDDRDRDHDRRGDDDHFRRVVVVRNEADHRQQTKNEWRNIAYGAGAVGVLGLLKHDNTLTFAGAAGALYATYRYEEDRKSQNRENRMRAEFFSRPYFVRDGERFDRRTVVRGGKRYYQFCRHR